jgi:uncharacterized membrane protein YqjE
MTDLLAVAKMIADDPLVEAFALMAVGVLVTRLLFKQHPIRRAIARVVFFVLLSVLCCMGESFPISLCIRPARPFMMLSPGR